MKHPWKATLTIVALFLITQIIGLAVIKTYTTGWQVSKTVEIEGVPTTIVENINKTIPYGFEPPKVQPQISLISIIVAILFATFIILLFSRMKANMAIKLWFAFVVLITIAVALSTVMHPSIALLLSAFLTYFKIFRREIIIHNLTELLVHPGLAAIFVPILNIPVTILLLIFISFYDFYAVIKSKHMIKLAKYQMEELKIFTGFLLPYLRKKDLERLKKLRELQEKKRPQKSKIKSLAEKIRVNVAALGGGDVAFPLIFSGVVLKTFNSFLYGIIISIFASLALFYLLRMAKKGKFYPAMPFITVGCLLGYAIVWLLIS